jgi:hypothetical protein
MDEGLFQLVYVSEATQEFGSRELLEILTQAKANNRARDITGNLLYNAGLFLQVLEGEKASVETLYSKIKRDPRHRRVRLLYLEPADFRLFGNWSMNMINLDQSQPTNYQKLQELVQAAASGKQVDRLPAPVKLLRMFRKN